MQSQNIIGPQVRKIRDTKGLTQDLLATHCNLIGWDVSRATISKIEARLRRVNDAEVELLAVVLKVHLQELYPEQNLADLLEVARQGKS